MEDPLGWGKGCGHHLIPKAQQSVRHIVKAQKYLLTEWIKSNATSPSSLHFSAIQWELSLGTCSQRVLYRGGAGEQRIVLQWRKLANSTLIMCSRLTSAVVSHVEVCALGIMCIWVCAERTVTHPALTLYHVGRPATSHTDLPNWKLWHPHSSSENHLKAFRTICIVKTFGERAGDRQRQAASDRRTADEQNHNSPQAVLFQHHAATRNPLKAHVSIGEERERKPLKWRLSSFNVDVNRMRLSLERGVLTS